MRFLLVILAVLLMTANVFAAEKSLLMATTTSTDNTGLLEYLEPIFEKDTGIDWKWTATGTGKALELGKNCDADILLVHAPAAEKEYINNGYGVYRKEVMYNDFVIVGPPSDPANISGKKVGNALEAIYNNGSVFVSRGDDSGTNKKEISLWKSADLKDYNKKGWYKETGQGMIATLNIATEMNGYTMTDRGTYIKYQSNYDGKAPLQILVEGDKILYNQYSLIPVGKERCPDVKMELAEKFTSWMTSDKIQQAIADYKLLGKKLFIPNAR
ncbi:MAG: tungsten ABC transporter substrate-binding protein [Flexistipes sinusarabici]|uniref:Tungsten ABC transporter substrate-binding protein n=1 Tax=Flexistipes sinusarabici TaxID=2352 RepID=A0A5D0MLS6_FLESI|nr:substrate-binding domain-containing protein [Flexistipes sinusarabici]TYB32905.1 MAG: tungsten ABC transporter substrate-binding protein [Flexistipes sinusarabici]